MMRSGGPIALDRSERAAATTAPTSVETAIRLQSVTKLFGATKAVDGIDLEIPARRVYGLIGPNGAGKTTVIRKRSA